MFINKVREGDSNFTYATYLERIEKIAKHAAQKHDYRYSTTISAIASAATELVQSDEWLKKVGQHIYWPPCCHMTVPTQLKKKRCCDVQHSHMDFKLSYCLP